MNEDKSALELLQEEIEENLGKILENFLRIEEINDFSLIKRVLFYREEWLSLIEENRALVEKNRGLLYLILYWVEVIRID